MHQLHFCLGLALVIGQLASCWATPANAHKRWGQQYEAKDKRGAVASESSVCSHIGIDLIKDGGNAADAVSLCFLRHATSRLTDWAAIILIVGGYCVLHWSNRNVS